MFERLQKKKYFYQIVILVQQKKKKILSQTKWEKIFFLHVIYVKQQIEQLRNINETDMKRKKNNINIKNCPVLNRFSLQNLTEVFNGLPILHRILKQSKVRHHRLLKSNHLFWMIIKTIKLEEKILFLIVYYQSAINTTFFFF